MSESQVSTLVAQSLRKKYKARTVVEDVSFEVKSGEVVGLLGPNGAGKTTCFYMIVGLVPAEDAKFDRHGDYSELAARRARTAAASCWSIFTVSSQPIQASVTDTP